MTREMQLIEVRQHLEAWMSADLALAKGQEFRMGSRLLRMPDLQYVRSMIQYWEEKVSALEGGRGRKRHFHIIPVDL